jgi:hypothetical protein
MPWIGQNSKSPEYHFDRQLCRLSDGPQYGSKQLAIYILRLSETRPVAESAILGRFHLSDE